MRTILIIFCITIFQLSVSAQNKYDFEFKIESKAFDKERKFYVHVPERYYENPDEKFGVIYILDGQGREYYNQAKAIIDYMVWSYQIMPFIVVGIHSDDRGPEFVPKDRKLAMDDSNNNGEAQLLQAHIEEEIFPIIEDSFRVKDFRAIVGHSRGGAFTATTLFSDKRDMFHAYISISPGMHYINNQILNDAKSLIQAGTKFNKFYLCTHGTVGELEKYFKPQVEYIDSLLKAHPNESLVWHKKEFTGATHWTQVAPAMTYGIVEMNRAFQADEYLIQNFAEHKDKSIKKQIDDYYEEQQIKLGMTFPIEASSYRYYGNQHSEFEDYESAIELYKLSQEIEPDNYNLQSGMAWAYRQMDRKEDAITCYNKSLDILESGTHSFSKENVVRIKEYLLKQLEELK